MKTIKRTSLLFFFLSSLHISSLTYAVTLDAGDLTRLPSGTNLALMYLQHTSGSDLYAKGNKVDNNADIDVDVSIFRGVKYIDIGNYTIVPQFLLPFGNVKASGSMSELDTNNGFGDLILASTIHFMQDPERKKAFALVPYIYVPTGSYDREKDINIGENRWKMTLQLGYTTPLSSKWSFDAAGDVTFFGDNEDYTSNGLTLKQEPLYEFQSHLRYHISPDTYVAGMVSHLWGGRTEVVGVSQDDQKNRTKGLVSVGHSLTPTLQLLASYGKDFHTENGIAEDQRINFRILKAF